MDPGMSRHHLSVDFREHVRGLVAVLGDGFGLEAVGAAESPAGRGHALDERRRSDTDLLLTFAQLGVDYEQDQILAG